MYTFSLPVNSGLKPEPSSRRALILPVACALAPVGVRVPR